MGAIGDPSCLGILTAYLTDLNETVRQTCELAISKINFETTQNDEQIPSSIYTSIDPAPPSTKTESTEELKAHLLNTNLPLFERYRAMFALRNIGDTEAVLALAEGLEDESGRLGRLIYKRISIGSNQFMPRPVHFHLTWVYFKKKSFHRVL